MNEQSWWAPWGANEHCRLWPGTRPLLISLPHDGVELPVDIAARMTPAARMVPDTDWHVGRLYDFARELGASILRPRWSRYVVDLNRPPDGAALYPGKSETGLCPTSTFACEAIYVDGAEPDAAKREQRVDRYWRPYHAALDATLSAMRARHGKALLWEGHSIVGTCPLFFAGRLPDYNLGTAEGRSCGPAIEQALLESLADSAVDFAHNGRFKGGYITRHYGRPADRLHAVQMELVQANYMDEGAPFAWHEARAAATALVLRGLLERALGALEPA